MVSLLDGPLEIPGPWPDLIAAILADWVSLLLICAIELLIHWDARLKIAFQTLKVMIGFELPPA